MLMQLESLLGGFKRLLLYLNISLLDNQICFSCLTYFYYLLTYDWLIDVIVGFDLLKVCVCLLTNSLSKK